MEGLNENWQIAPPNHIIQYEELPPGKYQLVMQASRSGNYFQGPERIIRYCYKSPILGNKLVQDFVSICISDLIYALLENRLHQTFEAQTCPIRRKIVNWPICDKKQQNYSNKRWYWKCRHCVPR